VRSRSACSAARYVGAIHLGEADVVEDQPQDVLDHLAALDDLDRRDDQPLLEDRRRARGQRARQPAARVHLVAELRRPADELVLEEDRHEHEPVVRVRDRRRALVRVRREDHVARIDAAVPVAHHLVDVGAELADDHPPARVGDHRELVVLLADDRAHRRAEQHRVHLVPRVAQRVLDDVEGDRIDLLIRDPGDAKAVLGRAHRASSGVIRMFE
jgi:hypothetical protein